MANKIRALFIFEILGRPPEHIKKTLEEFVHKLGQQKGVEIDRKEIMRLREELGLDQGELK